jgi:hypothetical protein
MDMAKAKHSYKPKTAAQIRAARSAAAEHRKRDQFGQFVKKGKKHKGEKHHGGYSKHHAASKVAHGGTHAKKPKTKKHKVDVSEIGKCASCGRIIFGGSKGMTTHRRRHH